MKKKLITILSLALFILGCSSKDGEKKSGVPQEKVVVVSQGSKPKSLDPNMYNEIPALAVTEQIFNTLLRVDDKGNVVPELAESYEYVSPTELVIKIKKNVKFHNGDIMTVNDVVFSLNRMLEKPASRIMVEIIDKIDIIDDSTIKLTLKNSSAPLLFSLAHPLTAILNEKDTKAKNDMIATEPMGTGPYKFVSWGDGEKIEFVAFDDYFEGRPKIDKLIIRAITENSSRLAALETGEIDIAYSVAPVDTGVIENNKKLELISAPTTSTEYMTLNTTKAPFNNKDFRVALNYALDKQSMADSVFMGKARPATTIVNPNVFGYSSEVLGFEYNPEKAKELIKKSGVANPNFKLYVNDNAVRLQLAQIVQANFKEIGIDMEIETLEWGAYLQRTAQGEHTAFIGGWVSGTSDADIVLYPLLHSSSHGGAGNRAFYTNKEFDKEVELARATSDPEVRKTHYKNAQMILQEESPLIVLLYKNENIGINKRIKGFKFDPTTMHNLYNLDIVEVK
ncbi:ABC transporter substrate-binding protein [Fusobacterium sp.]|uniref:ABC transporter substrate-binding protein n=1 Tax=Fusobacterium sp. TaxID=68766 RepID=UPI0028FE3F9C|nr:ABC transporter substrate-binding protein [Fusobacterium sp.]MDU1911371.1 ABC transporter substrate-binding protein [Fusobacterium sp.]